MPELNDDIKSTSASIVSDATTLVALETAKAQLPAGDPRVLELSVQAKRLAKGVSAKASVELELVEEVRR